MASSSGNSCNSTKLIPSSGSEEEYLQNLMDQRKKKRKQSNRESAKRSRLRKQQHLDDLSVEVECLKKQNGEIVTKLNVITKHFVQVEAQNRVLRAQIGELSQSLQSLNEIIDFINNSVYQTECYLPSEDHFMNIGYLNQPIMASADMFQW